MEGNRTRRPADPAVEGRAYTVEYDPDLDAVVFRWDAFVHGEQFREGAETLVAAFESADTDRLLVDARAFGEHRDADRGWFLDVCVPRLVDAGARRTAIVHSGSTLQELDLADFGAAAETFPGEVHLGDDLVAATRWLEESTSE